MVTRLLGFLSQVCRSDLFRSHITVLEPTGIPVIGTPSISLEYIYLLSTGGPSISHRRYIHRWRSIYQQVIIDGEPVTGNTRRKFLG